MMEAVHLYEGTVNQVMGDGIMALFGAPIAHEDHALRACYAALAMQEQVKRQAKQTRRAHGVSVQIRVGLSSGEVVVREIGSDLRMDYSAVGQTAHLAARMEQLASPGSILLTAPTLALVESYIAVKPLGPTTVKGLAEPIAVYEATGTGPARTRLQAAARRGLTRFVGRGAALARLLDALERAHAGQGQLAAVVGEAGVGKSRLVYEFTHSDRLQGWRVLEASSVSYGKATSYLPVIDLLKRYFQLQERDDVEEVRRKVTRKLLALDESLQPTLPALLAFLDVPEEDAAWRMLDPDQRRERMLEGVRRLLLREAHEQPLLVIVEDLHWIDGETQALLDGLIDELTSTRLLLLVSCRPEYQHSWGGKTWYRELRLDALADESAAALLDALLGEDASLAPLKQLLVRRGNPFFLEESVQTLVETKALVGERGSYRLTQPIQAISVAPTVQAVLAARIDRLPAEEKRLLQVASVVGKHFALALLRAIAQLADDALGRGLDRLQASEFIYESGRYPHVEYTFKHALTHEVTYGGLLQERRRELHARIVEAIETLHAGRLGPHTEQLAHHALRGELREKAVRYLRKAGNRSAARSALEHARVCFEQALAVLDALPRSQSTLERGFDIRLEQRAVLVQLGEAGPQLERLREAEALAEQLNDDRRRGRVYAFLLSIRAQRGELDAAIAAGARALAIAAALRDLELRILATSLLAPAHYFGGDYGRVIELATDNLAALPAEWTYESFGSSTPASVFDRHWLAMSLAQLGRFSQAGRYADEAIRIVAPKNQVHSVLQAYYAAGTLKIFQGDWTAARGLFEHGIALLPGGNPLLMLPWSITSSAWTLAQLGETDHALSRLRQGELLLERHAERGVLGQAGWAYHTLGRACLLLGRNDEARRLAGRALAASPCHPGFAAHAQHLLGDVASHPDSFDANDGEARYRSALELAEPRRMRPLIAHCHFGLGALCLRAGKRHEARERLMASAAMYREMEMSFWLAQANARLAELK